ncbi:MAG: hypothetical protein A4S17_00495 [Proteobacteria bacterium HN_bin10]|nr:MAG: hypothetical protein A4S17_00495 [Proteobacteria bacterium HN_bin10]
MLLALYLGALNLAAMIGAALRYPIPIAVGLYYGGEALRSGWGPVETLGAGMFAFIATGAVLQLAMEAQNVAVRSTALLVTTGASAWVGFQMLEAGYLLTR